MFSLKNKLLRTFEESFGRCSVLRHGFWFVDIPRTSSTSIRSELGKRFGRTYGKLNTNESDYTTPQLFPDHMPATEMRRVLTPYIWNRIFKFTIVRNPWDRTFSMYNYRRKRGHIPAQMSFRDYVFELANAEEDHPLFDFHGFRLGAAEYVLDEKGELMVDFVGYFENRSNDLKKVADKLKLKDFGKLCLQKATPGKTHYSKYYDDETKDIIGNLYAQDVELFGYRFEKEAQTETNSFSIEDSMAS